MLGLLKMSDPSADEAEILALIHRNRIAVWTNDFDTWETCFVHAPYTTRWGWWRSGGVFVRQGWELLRSRARTGPGRNDRNAFETKVTRLMLRIDGDMAWATFDQEYPPSDEFGHVGPGTVHEARVFERHGGQWKIAFLGFLDASAGVPTAVTIGLDADARVLWKSPAAAALLAESDDLVVRNGRLRFRDARTDRKLEETVRWAAAQDGGYMSSHAARPIAVDRGDGLPMRIYWVTMDAGRIVFSLADDDVGEQRLDMAAEIYGLSPVQRQVAALVAEGLALPQIGERLGISTNTARTHLQRIYDKTGVHTQAALVRVLLSAVPPL